MLFETPDTLQGQSGTPPVPVNILAVETRLSESNAKIAQRVQDVRLLTEREVLACGNVFAEIVKTASHLSTESERSLALSLERSEEINSRFVRGMRGDILAQTTAVQQVLELANGIGAAADAINDLTVSSRVLAVNARIEAARLGEQGKGFAVIADNLSGLSKIIRSTAEKVSLSIEAVRQGLGPVRDRAASMDDRTQFFIDEMAAQVLLASPQTGPGGSAGRLAAVMELSNQALSHLQFQDSASQKLFAINSDLEVAKERVLQVLKGGENVAEPDANEVTGEEEPAAGEVMLF